MSPSEPDRAVLSPSEVATALRSVTEAGWLRLRMIARYYANICSLEAEDLLQTALTRALAGERQCPVQVDVIRFLAEAMRSIASISLKSDGRQEAAQERHPVLRLVAPEGEEPDPEGAFAPSPEDALASEQEAARIKAAILGLFNDDPIAQFVIEARMEEMDAEEIRALTDLSKVAYASKLRLIRRRIDQAFPQGWTQ